MGLNADTVTTTWRTAAPLTTRRSFQSNSTTAWLRSSGSMFDKQFFPALDSASCLHGCISQFWTFDLNGAVDFFVRQTSPGADDDDNLQQKGFAKNALLPPSPLPLVFFTPMCFWSLWSGGGGVRSLLHIWGLFGLPLGSAVKLRISRKLPVLSGSAWQPLKHIPTQTLTYPSHTVLCWTQSAVLTFTETESVHFSGPRCHQCWEAVYFRFFLFFFFFS